MIRVPSTLGDTAPSCAPCAPCAPGNGSNFLAFAVGFGSSLLASFVFYQMSRRERRA